MSRGSDTGPRPEEYPQACNNCGRPEHTDRLIEEFIDGDGQPLEIIVCDKYSPLSLEGSIYRKE